MDIAITFFSLFVLLFSVIIHEVAHGSVAYYMGDPTAKDAGRLTLNPLKHLDPFGSVIVPLFLFISTMGEGPIFAWAKPVPVNPYNFRDQRWGALKVAIAGPATNFLIGIIFSLIIRFFSLSQGLLSMFTIIAFYNFAWGIFNMIPFPPLDGYHILFAFLPRGWENIKFILKRYSLILFFLFIMFGLRFVFLGAAYLYTLVAGL